MERKKCQLNIVIKYFSEDKLARSSKTDNSGCQVQNKIIRYRISNCLCAVISDLMFSNIQSNISWYHVEYQIKSARLSGNIQLHQRLCTGSKIQLNIH